MARPFTQSPRAGVLQDTATLSEPLGRQSIAPADSGWVFRLTPFVMVGVMLTIATALPVVTVDSVAAIRDLITLIYLFAIARFFFIAGSIPAARSISDRRQP